LKDVGGRKMRCGVTRTDEKTGSNLLRPRRVLVLIILLCIFGYVTGCANSHVHQTQALELIDSIAALLISEKLCKDKNDCLAKRYFFIKPSSIIRIYVYGITDPIIAKNIVSSCIDAHLKNPSIEYELLMYRETKDETLASKQETIMLSVHLK
jgi:hypothetical protein